MLICLAKSQVVEPKYLPIILLFPSFPAIKVRWVLMAVILRELVIGEC